MMEAPRNFTDGFFCPPTADGLRLSGLFVLPGEALRLRWTIDGWGWVVARTTGEFVEKQSILFFGQTEIEFKLVQGQEIELQVINPFGRVSKRFIAVPNLQSKPVLPKALKDTIASSIIELDASVCRPMVQANSAALEALCQTQAEQSVRGPDVIRMRPPDVNHIQSNLDLDALKASTKDLTQFNFTKPWVQEWEKLSALARTANSNEGVSNVNH
jgi:hypothetical protein